MNSKAITVENLAKQYKIGKQKETTSGGRRYLPRIQSPLAYLTNTRSPIEDNTIWALYGITFSVDNGEVVGIIGRNGAGKSTLLKILSRITEPTHGKALVKGRVGSLLEVGTGFHPELTGRENIYLSGAILGMKRVEIQRKFDEIVAFAEVDKFLDTPVKRYSSGMYVRLAFSVAAHLEPEILLVDEVLAVGDARFQKKCLGKMSDVATQGRTILFVSHNMIAIQNLCNRVIWLHEGKIVEEGSASAVVSNYLSTSFSALTEQIWPDIITAPGNDIVRIHRATIRPENGLPKDPITMSTPCVVDIEYWNLVPNNQLSLTLYIYTEQQIIAFATASDEKVIATQDTILQKGRYRSTCFWPANLLNEGVHRVRVFFVQNTDHVIYRQDDVLCFQVLDIGVRRGMWYGKEPGALHPLLNWTTQRIEDDR